MAAIRGNMGKTLRRWNVINLAVNPGERMRRRLCVSAAATTRASPPAMVVGTGVRRITLAETMIVPSQIRCSRAGRSSLRRGRKDQTKSFARSFFAGAAVVTHRIFQLEPTFGSEFRDRSIFRFLRAPRKPPPGTRLAHFSFWLPPNRAHGSWRVSTA